MTATQVLTSTVLRAAKSKGMRLATTTLELPCVLAKPSHLFDVESVLGDLVGRWQLEAADKSVGLQDPVAVSVDQVAPYLKVLLPSEVFTVIVRGEADGPFVEF